MNAATSVDENVRKHRQRRVEAQEGHRDRKPADRRPQPRQADAGRWRTLNTFVDVIAPNLLMADRAAWLVLFRYTRNGTVDTSERQLATAAGIDKVTAGRALRRLVQLRLVWPIKVSKSKGSASRYGLHPNPEKCLGAVLADRDRRETQGVERRQERGGDRRGRRRNVDGRTG